MKIKLTYPLGSELKDKITGFQGVATGMSTYITGCDVYLIQPPVNKEGNHVEGRWLDVGRLELIKKKAVKLADVQGDENGADIEAPTK